MEIIETSSVGKSVIENHGRILIGLSIKNSYFKDGNLKKILEWVSKYFVHGYVMIPDEPAIYTLMSIGYEENRARTKAVLEANRLENKCYRIIEDSKLNNISMIRWKDIQNDKEYIDSLDKIKAAYATDESFKDALRDTTSEVITVNKTSLEISKAIDIGINFLFQELAFISNSADILKCDQVAYLYHKTMPVFKSMLDGTYELKAARNVGYITGV